MEAKSGDDENVDIVIDDNITTAEKKSETVPVPVPSWADQVDPAEPVIGIDLGTTFCCVYVCENRGQGPENPESFNIVLNGDGGRTTPSYVSFTPTECLIGQAAKDAMSGNVKNTIYDVKRLIGLHPTDPDVQDIIDNLTYKVGVINGKIMILADVFGQPRWLYAEEISALLLLQLKQDAENYLQRSVTFAVITVPEHFNTTQRNATICAANLAGLTVIDLLNEPTAASLGYCIKTNENEMKYVLVFDLGGGTFDVTLLAVGDKVIEVKNTGGDRQLGGEDFLNNLVEFCVNEIKPQFTKVDFDPYKDVESMQELRNACEKLKNGLSTASKKQINLTGIFSGASEKRITFKKMIAREAFVSLNKELFDSTIETVVKVLKEAHMDPEGIDEVVLVEGSSRIPSIRKQLSELFKGKTLNQKVIPDEVVAHGAAVKAAISVAQATDSLHEWVFSDVTPYSLGIQYSTEHKFCALIPRGKTMPYTSKIFITHPHKDYQQNVKISVYEGESEYTKDNKFLCSFRLKDITRGLKKEVEIHVQFHLSSTGILSATATDFSTGREASNNAQITMAGIFTLEEMREMKDRLHLYFTGEYKNAISDEAPEILE